MHIDKMQLHVTGRIYLYYKREKKSCVVDVTVPNDTQKERENMKKHTPFAIKIHTNGNKRMWQYYRWLYPSYLSFINNEFL